MKKIILIIVSIYSIASFAQTINVKQDSTGDFVHIQEAVNAAVNGDTILVWPGTYYENIDITETSVVLASLALTTGDDSYINSTIINGNKNGSCIKLNEINDNVIVHGFTITNGSGNQSGYRFYGGGIFVFKSVCKISNCIIKDNEANVGAGGGICIWESETDIEDCSIFNNSGTLSGGGIANPWKSSLEISGTIIHGNHAYIAGGGIMTGYMCSTQFDSVNRCSMYNNFASHGSEIYKSSEATLTEVFVDTFTVINPDTYFILSTDIEGYPLNNISFNANTSIITPHDGDLYVDPVNGNNNNSGTSEKLPFKSVAWAYSRIAVDSLERNTIHLANGIYSDSANNEYFPLNIRPFVNVVGQKMDSTIFDGRHKTKLLQANNLLSNFSFSNITIKRGRLFDLINYPFNNYSSFGEFNQINGSVSLDSMVFTNGSCAAALHGISGVGRNSSISNCTFSNFKGGRILGTFAGSVGDTSYISNCKFINNGINEEDTIHHSGGAARIGGLGGTMILTNTFFDNNAPNALYVKGLDLYASNCTFVNHTYPLSSTVSIAGSKFRMYNSIIYNDAEYAFWVSTNPNNDSLSEFYLYNSLLEGGEDKIKNSGDMHYIYYDSTNIDTNPNFLGMWGDPYMISDGSPCIDAGTLAKLPAFINLPDKDLAGNPRIVGDSIDMGAYEWNPTIVGFHDIGPNANKKESLLKAWPNPFSWETTIVINNRLDEKCEVEIYDNYGKLVKNIISTSIKGKEEILWQGDDYNGNPMPTGIYHVVMFSGEREIENLKVVKK